NGQKNTGTGSAAAKPCFHAVPPSDPLRQANRLPIKVLKMLTARTGHILHPEYLQPLPSTPVSPIELDAKKSPLALLAQTCSQIGKPDPSPSSKLSSVTSNGSGGDKDSNRYHPYSKSPLPTPGAPVPVPAATGPYYSPYALYGQRLTTASALGSQ
ncbi:Zinc finger protein 503, partial [Aptenodytes forsteri]